MSKEVKERTVESLAIERKSKEQRRKKISQKEKDENIIAWTTLFRRNINLYASEYLGIRLYPFQHYMLYLMSISKVFFAICTRGLTKSFIVALFAVCKCMLYPYSGVVITATTIKQAEKMVKNKMENEICKKLSPVLKYYHKKGWIKFSYGKEEIRVDFLFNGSWIIVAPSVDSSRGDRVTLVIYEECRLLKKGIIDSVFEPMGQPRQANFLNLEEYNLETRESMNKKKRWLEESQSIYITSSRFKSEWFWKTFLNTVNECYTNKYEKEAQNFFVGDIFLAINHGIKTIPEYFKLRKTMGDLDFRMEVLNEMVGEAEGAFFSRELFKKNQVIKKGFIPPTINEIFSETPLNNREKIEGEVRLIFIDFAFSESISTDQNDNSTIGLMSLVPRKQGGYKRIVDYISRYPAGDSDGFDLRIRELFHDYKADYIVIDQRNGGEVFYSDLSKKKEHPERASYDIHTNTGWRDNGFTISIDEKYHLVSSQKQVNLQKRAIDSEAIPCIIPITATPEQNSSIWLEMQKTLRDGKIDLLIEDIEYEQMFEESDEYFTLESEEKARRKAPFNNTMELINEAVNLKQIWKSGLLKLEEPRSGTKDMIVALAYGNYIAKLIEEDLMKDDNYGDLDIDSLSDCIIW